MHSEKSAHDCKPWNIDQAGKAVETGPAAARHGQAMVTDLFSVGDAAPIFQTLLRYPEYSLSGWSHSGNNSTMCGTERRSTRTPDPVSVRPRTRGHFTSTVVVQCSTAQCNTAARIKSHNGVQCRISATGIGAPPRHNRVYLDA
jgi:hypothetical protein